MIPKWLFVDDDSSSAAGSNIQVVGTMVATSNANRYNLTSWTESGSDLDDWEEYPHSPVRKSARSISFLLELTATGTWNNKSAFAAGTSSYTGSLQIGSNTLPHTSISITGPGNGTTVFVRFNASTSDTSAFWANVASGQTLNFNFSYSGT